MPSDTGKETQARDAVFRLLKYRPRSENEIRDKLKTQQFSSDMIESTVRFFKERDFINDRLFARGWIASRLNRPLGLKRIRYELIQKGIDRNIIKEELDEASAQYCEEEAVFDLARKRMRKYTHLDEEKAKKRLIGYLGRRGFDAGTIFKVAGKL